MSYAGKDANHDDVVTEARRWGASVLELHKLSGRKQLEEGIPDLLVCFRGAMAFWEVKNRTTAYGRAGLTEAQKRFRARWPAVKHFEISGIEDVRRALGVG